MIVIAGASREMLSLARELDLLPGLLVDPSVTSDEWHGLPVHRSDEEAVADGQVDGAILAIDNPHHRSRAFAFYRAANIPVLDLLASASGEGTTHGEGLTVQKLAHLSVDCTLGCGVRLNVGAKVMHDVTLDDFSTVAPNAVLLAGVRVGNYGYIGANAVVLQNVSVGAGATIGAGAVVTKDVPDGAVVKGNPAA